MYVEHREGRPCTLVKMSEKKTRRSSDLADWRVSIWYLIEGSQWSHMSAYRRRRWTSHEQGVSGRWIPRMLTAVQRTNTPLSRSCDGCHWRSVFLNTHHPTPSYSPELGLLPAQRSSSGCKEFEGNSGRVDGRCRSILSESR